MLLCSVNGEDLLSVRAGVQRDPAELSTELVPAKPSPSLCASAGSQNRVLVTLRRAASTESGLKHQYLSLKKRKKSMNMLGGTVL